MQVSPDSAIPLDLPSTPFSGDAVAASLSAAPGAVNLLVTQGNAPGMMTEVLVQRLASVHRAAYPEKFRSAGFSAWASGGTVLVPLSAGVYAVAIRTVKSATGQSGQLMEIGRAVVS